MSNLFFCKPSHSVEVRLHVCKPTHTHARLLAHTHAHTHVSCLCIYAFVYAAVCFYSHVFLTYKCNFQCSLVHLWRRKATCSGFIYCRWPSRGWTSAEAPPLCLWPDVVDSLHHHQQQHGFGWESCQAQTSVQRLDVSVMNEEWDEPQATSGAERSLLLWIYRFSKLPLAFLPSFSRDIYAPLTNFANLQEFFFFLNIYLRVPINHS